VDPSVVLDVTSRDRVAGICRVLDGVPLAIELAAARLASYPLAELHDLLGDRLGSRLDLLTAQGGERPARHRTLRTTIGWSNELCAPVERLLWARLSVFPQTFTAAGATWVCAGGPLPAEQVADVLLGLVRQSIVLRHPADPERFRMLDTVREYGADWLRELGEEQQVRLRHRDHYRRFAREACSDWNSGRQVAWCERILAEHANLRAAMDCALAEPAGRIALEMAGNVGFLWRHSGFPRDAEDALDQVLAHEHAVGPELFLAMWARSAVATVRGELDTGIAWAERSAVVAKELGDPASLVAAAAVTGPPVILKGRLAEGIELLSSAPRLPAGPAWHVSLDLQVRLILSHALLFSGDLDEAERTVQEVRADSERCGERWARAVADSLVAQIALMRGDHETALRHARQSVAGNRLVHSTFATAYAYEVLVSAAVRVGDSRYSARLEGVGRRVYDVFGRAQFDSPQLIAAQRDRERLLRDRLGDQAYEQAYAEGAAMSYDEGLDYALAPDA
jgi:predicted ATPase